MVVGGTAADASRLRVRGSRVIVDFSDYSSLLSLPPNSAKKIGMREGSVSDADDDEFESLAAQRRISIFLKQNYFRIFLYRLQMWRGRFAG